MNIIIINLLVNTMGTIIMAYFLIKVLEKSWTNKRNWILLLSCLIIFMTFMHQILQIPNMIFFIVILIISTNIYAYLLNTEFSKILVYNLLGETLIFTFEIIIISIISIMEKLEPCVIQGMNYYTLFSTTISLILFYLIVKLSMEKIRIPKGTSNNYINRIILMGFFNIIIIFMAFALYNNLELHCGEEYLYLICTVIGAVVFNIIIYRITQRIIEQNKKETIWKMREEELLKEDFYIKNMNEILQTIRSQRHDLNNYLSTLYGLIHLEKFEESKKYITEINSRISNMDNIIETNHPVITALITMKTNKALEDNIDIDFDINLPNKLPLDFVDLSIIIGNLIDNAIEACQLVEEDIKRQIKLSIDVKGKFLIIGVNNAKKESIEVDTKDIMKRFTTKEDNKNHGYGLGNVEYVVKHYNGVMHLEDIGNKFKVYISLPI